MLKRIAEKTIKSRDAARRTAVPQHMANRALKHSHTHGRAWLWPLQHVHAGPMHGRASLRLFLLALSGLRLTSILPSIPPESYLSHQNPKVLSESTDKPQYKHN